MLSQRPDLLLLLPMTPYSISTLSSEPCYLISIDSICRILSRFDFLARILRTRF